MLAGEHCYVVTLSLKIVSRGGGDIRVTKTGTVDPDPPVTRLEVVRELISIAERDVREQADRLGIFLAGEYPIVLFLSLEPQ